MALDSGQPLRAYTAGASHENPLRDSTVSSKGTATKESGREAEIPST